MTKILIVPFLILFCLSICTAQKCSFIPNSDCRCLPSGQGGGLTVTCKDMDIFPTFTDSRLPIDSMHISGTYPEIPKDAFLPLTGDLGLLFFERTGEFSIPLTIDDEAFVQGGVNSTMFSITLTNFITMSSIPTVALSNAKKLFLLSIISANIIHLADDSFNGTKLQDIQLMKTGINTVGDNAFRGLERSLGQLEISYNPITEVPTIALQPLNVGTLIMKNNQINQIGDNAFASKSYESVELAGNPLKTLSDKSFYNATIFELDLTSCQFESVPVNGLLAINNSMINFNIAYNKITKVTAGTYSNLRNVQDPGLDDNPLTNIEPDAFYGMYGNALFTLDHLPDLQTLDLNIIDGVRTATQMMITYSPKLQNITISDPDKMPSYLTTIQIDQGTDVRYLDPKIGDWLKLSRQKLLYIDGNSNFVCTPDIAWMGFYVFCPVESQINIDGTRCQTTNTLLKSYLRTIFDVTSCK